MMTWAAEIGDVLIRVCWAGEAWGLQVYKPLQEEAETRAGWASLLWGTSPGVTICELCKGLRDPSPTPSFLGVLPRRFQRLLALCGHR